MTKPIIFDLTRSGGDATLQVQLYRALRDAILAGGLPPGSRLPSTRTMSADVGVSRSTAEEAFGRLEREGYVERRVGDGTYVSTIPLWGRASARPGGLKAAPTGIPNLSNRGRSISRDANCEEPKELRAFNAGAPDVRAFPFEIWHRLLARRSRQSGRDLLGYGDPAGYAPLREAVAAYCSTSRGVRCDASQVVILTSSQQAIDLAARLLLDPGDEVLFEEPGYPGARAAFRAAGATLVPVRVDDDGMRVDDGIAAAPRARLAYVTPSSQYPLAVTLALDRRLALLAWARAHDAWIVEDDYNSEMRYDGRPIAAIQGLADDARVIYAGTFTKTMFPSIRIAYAVLPRGLVGPFVRARTQLDGHTATLTQAALADFVSEGHFGAHLRRMRTMYRARRDALLEVLHRELKHADVGTAAGGFHLVLGLHRRDRDLVARGREHGLDLVPLSRAYLSASPPSGLLVGYTALTPQAIRAGARTLARLL